MKNIKLILEQDTKKDVVSEQIDSEESFLEMLYNLSDAVGKTSVKLEREFFRACLKFVRSGGSR